jgi:hypothetical protein
LSLRVRALTKPTMGAYRGTMGRVLAIFWAGPAHVTPPSQPFSAKNGRKTEGAKKTTTAILNDGSVLVHTRLARALVGVRRLCLGPTGRLETAGGCVWGGCR